MLMRQPEAGSADAEVARAFEINPNLLHRWRKELRPGPGYPNLAGSMELIGPGSGESPISPGKGQPITPPRERIQCQVDELGLQPSPSLEFRRAGFPQYGRMECS
jgi:transposase-like protein